MAFKLDSSDNITPVVWLENTKKTDLATALTDASDGDTIRLSEGKHSSGSVTVSNNKITIVGAGRGRTKILGRIIQSSDDLKLQDMTVKAPSGSTNHAVTNSGNADGLILKRVVLIGSSDAGSYSLYLDGADYVVLDDVDCDDSWYGIRIENNTVPTILKHVRIKVLWIGIHLGVSATSGIADLKDVEISGCGTLGIQMIKDSIIRMKDVNIHNCYSGINAAALAGETITIEATRCKIIDNTDDGVVLSESGGGIVTQHFKDCQIHGNGGYDAESNFTANMEYNWWGTDSPSAGQFNDIDYNPYLDLPTIEGYIAKHLTESGGIADFTLAEKEQIRDALGVDGSKTTATGGQLQAKSAETTLTSHESSQATSRGIISTNLDQVLSVTESDIRGADSDTLKNISDEIAAMETAVRGSDSDDLKVLSEQLDNIEAEAQVEISTLAQYIIPLGQSTLDGALGAGASSAVFDDVSNFADWGYFQCENEIAHYTARNTTTNTLTGLTRGMFGTADALHADATDVYAAVPHRVKLTIHDAGVPKSPSGDPTIEVVNLAGDTKVASTPMTQEGAKVGIFYHDIILKSDEPAPQTWDIRITVIPIAGKTNEYRKIVMVWDEPASEGDVTGVTVSPGLRTCTQAGYIDGSAVFHAWTDDLVGAMSDDDGNLIFRGEIRFWNKVGGVTQHQEDPPGQAYTDVLGEWTALVPVGIFTVHFWKDKLVDEEVERTVT